MGQDRSLDEFVGGGSDGDEDAAGDDGEPEDPIRDADDAENPDQSDADDPERGVGEESDTVVDDEPDIVVDEASDTGIDDESDIDSDDESDAEEFDADESDPAPGDAEPATATYRWEPDGAECALCGATVERLWSGEAGQVCVDCKEW